MKEREKGSLTVEATISLTIYLFAMMFLMNAGQVYRAQNYVAHGMLQTGKMLSFASYEFGEDTTVSKLGDEFMRLLGFLGNIPDQSEIRLSWKDGNYPEAAKLAFGYCAGKNAAETNQSLERYGVTGGIGSIDFTKSYADGKDLYLQAQYTVDLPFAFFQISRIDMHQQVVCGLWEK